MGLDSRLQLYAEWVEEGLLARLSWASSTELNGLHASIQMTNRRAARLATPAINQLFSADLPSVADSVVGVTVASFRIGQFQEWYIGPSLPIEFDLIPIYSLLRSDVVLVAGKFRTHIQSIVFDDPSYYGDELSFLLDKQYEIFYGWSSNLRALPEALPEAIDPEPSVGLFFLGPDDGGFHPLSNHFELGS
jgi:hypothetical protein